MSEKLRLQFVKQYERLNLKYDKELMQTVSYAAKLCGSPICSITVLDKDTQWIKVNKGLTIDQVPRQLSFCTHVIKNNRLFVADDLPANKLFHAHPFVTGEPKLRFYAGMPLTTHEGHRIGTLCVMDYKSHLLTSQQKFIFKILAKHAMSIRELKLSLSS